MRLLIATLACTLALAGPARAELTASAPSQFVVESRATVSANADVAWRQLTRINRWWSDSHTYSGDAGNLSLTPRAGGCWCERWGGGQSVEHARVVLVMEHEGVKTLRVDGGLGPLQSLGVNAVLTFTLTPSAEGTNIMWTYRVSGDPSLNLDRIAPVVDAVITEQFGRFTRSLEGPAN